MTLASSYLGALDCKLLMGVTEVTQNHWRQLQKRPLNSLNHEIAWISTGIEDHSLKINISTFLLLHPILLRALQKTTWPKCQTLRQRSVSSIRPVGDLRFLKAAWRSSWGPLLTPAIDQAFDCSLASLQWTISTLSFHVQEFEQMVNKPVWTT